VIYFPAIEVTMFDNLREDAATFHDREEKAKFQPAVGAGGTGRRSSRFLGMTSVQRFVISALLFFAVCVIGALCLLVMGRIGIY
jgi:hypothetical protein